MAQSGVILTERSGTSFWVNMDRMRLWISDQMEEFKEKKNVLLSIFWVEAQANFLFIYYEKKSNIAHLLP